MGTIKDKLPQGSSRNKIEYLAEQVERVEQAGSSSGAVPEYANYFMELKKNSGEPLTLGYYDLTLFDSGRNAGFAVSNAQDWLDDWKDINDGDFFVLTMAGHLRDVVARKGLSGDLSVSGRIDVGLLIAEDAALSSFLDENVNAYLTIGVNKGAGRGWSVPIGLTRTASGRLEVNGGSPLTLSHFTADDFDSGVAMSLRVETPDGLAYGGMGGCELVAGGVAVTIEDVRETRVLPLP